MKNSELSDDDIQTFVKRLVSRAEGDILICRIIRRHGVPDSGELAVVERIEAEAHNAISLARKLKTLTNSGLPPLEDFLQLAG